MKKITIIILIILPIISCSNQKTMINIETVKKLEINKFLGTWYEIARFPHSFEKNLVGVTATYSLKKDGIIKVLNQGYKNTLNGELKKAVGKAKVPNADFPGKLKVSFFWIFYADYFVLELDENYKWAIIGSSSPKYLWILSRNSQMDEILYQKLIKKIIERGYNIENLIRVEQKIIK